jgi:hypothetical protein
MKHVLTMLVVTPALLVLVCLATPLILLACLCFGPAIEANHHHYKAYNGDQPSR